LSSDKIACPPIRKYDYPCSKRNMKYFLCCRDIKKTIKIFFYGGAKAKKTVDMVFRCAGVSMQGIFTPAVLSYDCKNFF